MARIRIGQLLIQAGLLTPQRLEEALTAQQIYGGRLGTILVEHGHVHEDDLARVLATQSGMPQVSRDELLKVDHSVIALLSTAQAERFQVVPFRFEPEHNRVSIGMTEPANLQKMDELQFALGKRVAAYLCPEIVLARALEKYYGVTRQVRFIAVQVDGARKASGAARGGGVQRQESGSGSGILDRIARAESAQVLLDTALECFTTFASQVVFFAVNGDSLAGWAGRGLIADPRTVAAATIRLAESPVLCNTLARQQALRGDANRDANLATLLTEQLFMELDEPLIAVPLIVAQQPYGVFLLAHVKPGRNADPALLSEIAHRVGMRAQAIHLMECVTAPLAGCP